MSIEILEFAKPFFTVRYLLTEKEYLVSEKSIVINLSEQPIKIQGQKLEFFQSVIVTNTTLCEVERSVLIEGIANYADESTLFDQVKKTWPLAYEVRKEERLKGVSHYVSPKASVGNIDLSMYYSGSVPLNVGLHKSHRGGIPLKEVHTQIVGYGKMQQFSERDINTLYLEEPLAPGATHKPMYDEQGNYPWHQYETITPAIFMAIEMLPSDQSAVE